MKRKIVTTADGSKTLQIEEWQEQYHSMHGAIQEAYHVFIKHGLNLFENKAIAILEIGFGTGLNAYITFLEAQYKGLSINYYGIEAYPVSFEEAMSMEYVTSLKDADFGQEAFELMHKSTWNVPVKIASFFNLLKLEKKFQDINDSNAYELIYFDAFGFRVQPELWSESIFLKMYTALRPGGVLVTYAAKGSVRRAMVSVGFLVERLEGPPGKREMLRATKPRLNTQI
ncbi:MAG: tRNA (5-methylaminomethyl-2-thiouridine)(34)-methyltransferase MnmD [Flavobacteriaceae bacterium]|nr:tRNA (5-methylaminomethyl-2-thiouridine)(34)-methyltransferase MnmD [Flavobacteriaceae bacterium]